MPRVRRMPPALSALIAVLLLMPALAGCTTGGPEAPNPPDVSSPPDASSPPNTPDPTGETTPGNLSIAVVGDSITVGSDPTFAPGQVSEDSWVSYAVGDPIELTGGWARWGATTEEMAAAAGPVAADVLVILAGTNDLAAGTPQEQVAANLDDIAARVGAEEVLLCAVPPLDAHPELVPPFNAFLAETAQTRGWAWVDPMADIRTQDRYAAGMSEDGVHPTQAGAAQIGEQVRAELLAGADTQG